MPVPPPSTIKHVIFDLGAVLLHWAPEEIVASFTSDTRLQATLLEGVFHHQHWQDMDQGLISEAEAHVHFAHNCDVKVERIQALMSHVRDCLTVKQGTLALLNEFRQAGYGIYGLSNICEELYSDMLQRHDFFQHFEDLIVSAAVKMIKPDPAIFDYALARFDINAEQTLFLDDNAANIASARGLGIHSIQFIDADSCRQQILTLLEGHRE